MRTAWRAVHVLLLLILSALATVCSGQSTTAPTAEAAMLAPVADAGTDISAMVAVAAVVDGSSSHDPRGQLLTYHWTIVEAPVGSTATLDGFDPAPTFV